jgi:hypothetical protein
VFSPFPYSRELGGKFFRRNLGTFFALRSFSDEKKTCQCSTSVAALSAPRKLQMVAARDLDALFRSTCVNKSMPKSTENAIKIALKHADFHFNSVFGALKIEIEIHVGRALSKYSSPP